MAKEGQKGDESVNLLCVSKEESRISIWVESTRYCIREIVAFCVDLKLL